MGGITIRVKGRFDSVIYAVRRLVSNESRWLDRRDDASHLVHLMLGISIYDPFATGPYNQSIGCCPMLNEVAGNTYELEDWNVNGMKREIMRPVYVSTTDPRESKRFTGRNHETIGGNIE